MRVTAGKRNTEGQASSPTLAEQKESRRVAAVSSSTSPFGQNEWLVEEMYRKFREDPSSVDPSWHEFLVDYSPEPTNDTPAAASTGNGQAAAPAKAAEPAAKAPEPAKAAEPAKTAEAAPVKPEPAKTSEAKPKAAASAPPAEGDEVAVLRGAAAAVVKNMNASLDVPTATSVRA